MKLIPRHRIDAPIIAIHPADEAWDDQKVEESAEAHGEDCPFLRYHRGTTRYDLGARGEHGAAQDFLSGSPVEFHLRRLSTLQLNEVQGMLEREITQGFPIPRAAYLLACRYGLMAVKQGASTVLDLERPGNLSEKDVEALGSLTDLGIGLVVFVGQASYAASQPLTEAEGKPSGS